MTLRQTILASFPLSKNQFSLSKEISHNTLGKLMPEVFSFSTSSEELSEDTQKKLAQPRSMG